MIKERNAMVLALSLTYFKESMFYTIIKRDRCTQIKHQFEEKIN